jgi:hypothetical protein
VCQYNSHLPEICLSVIVYHTQTGNFAFSFPEILSDSSPDPYKAQCHFFRKTTRCGWIYSVPSITRLLSVYYDGYETLRVLHGPRYDVTTLTSSKIDGSWLVLRWLRGTVCITIVTQPMALDLLQELHGEKCYILLVGLAAKSRNAIKNLT